MENTPQRPETDAHRTEKLAALSPFNRLGAEAQLELEQRGDFVLLPEKSLLFKEGDRDEFCHWLIEGELDLISADHEVSHLQADTLEARQPMDNSSPRTKTAVTTTRATLFRMPRTVVDFMTQLANNNNYMVSPVQDTHEAQADWMTGLLSSPVFELIPPRNIAQLFASFESLSARAGEQIIVQGETGTHFFVIQSGTARVEQSMGDTTQVLAHFGRGASFGEDALISDVPRNASVTMTSDGTLMRLSKEEFTELLQTPALSTVTAEELEQMRQNPKQEVLLLDVRNPEELGSQTHSHDLHIPLLQLRDRTGELDRETTYITVSDSGQRAALAAFILNSKGIGAYILSTGAATTA